MQVERRAKGVARCDTYGRVANVVAALRATFTGVWVHLVRESSVRERLRGERNVGRALSVHTELGEVHEQRSDYSVGNHFRK
jgi:hypothetical protein